MVEREALSRLRHLCRLEVDDLQRDLLHRGGE